MGIAEFVERKKGPGHFEERRQHAETAFNAAELAVNAARSAGAANNLSTNLAGGKEQPWFVTTPLVELEDGHKVAVCQYGIIPIGASGRYTQGYKLEVEVQEGRHAEAYAQVKDFSVISYYGVSPHRGGYQEDADLETVAAFQAVATAMEELAAGSGQAA